MVLVNMADFNLNKTEEKRKKKLRDHTNHRRRSDVLSIEEEGKERRCRVVHSSSYRPWASYSATTTTVSLSLYFVLKGRCLLTLLFNVQIADE